MTAEELRIEQNKLTDEIYKFAKENGLTIDGELEPITDGVADSEAYIESNPKVMWVLKEPYDEIEDGKPYGGGWSIVDDCFASIEKRSIAPTWHSIIYIMYGVRHNLKWDDIDYLSQDKSPAKVLKEIAYINVSKMPNKSETKDADLWDFYNLWQEILWKQIIVYNPDIIIFGNTFHLFKNDLSVRGNLKEISSNGVWSWNNKLLLAAYHPQRKGKQYVDNIIDIISTYYNPH